MRGEKPLRRRALALLLAAAGVVMFIAWPRKGSAKNFLGILKGAEIRSSEERIEEQEIKLSEERMPQRPPYRLPLKLRALVESNSWVVGWLKIDDTNIDYPVVQNREDNEWFLHRDIYGKESYPGSIYLDSWHDMEEKGLHVIYGHRMRDGTMFKDRSRFTDMDYLNSHKRIQMWTKKRKIRLEPVCCYVGAADGSYRNPIASEDELEAFLYGKTGYSVSSDNVFVFITCSYEQKDGRCYLICREVKD